MKLEFICERCGGKRFVKRSVGFIYEKDESSFIVKERYECNRCSVWIEIIFHKKGWMDNLKRKCKKCDCELCDRRKCKGRNPHKCKCKCHDIWKWIE
jgi:hypothetical protein